MQDPSLQCQVKSVDSWRLGEAWETVSALLAASSKSKWCVGFNHDWIPSCSRESHPRSAMPTFSPPPPPPPPPPPCTNLTFTVPPVPAHLSDDQPCCSCFFSLPLHPPPWKYVLGVYCHDEVVHQYSMLSGDPAGPPHGTWRTTAIHGWLTLLELYFCTDLLSCHSIFTTRTSFQPCITACILQRASILLTSQRGVCVLWTSSCFKW